MPRKISLICGIDNHSFLLDFKILLLTPKSFDREGISASGEATMSEFKGSKNRDEWSTKQVAIFGVSGYGREVMPLVYGNSCHVPEPFKLVFADDESRCAVLNGQEVLTYADWLAQPASSRYVSVASSQYSQFVKILLSDARVMAYFFMEVRRKWLN